MTFENLLEALGKRLGLELENAGGAAAVEIDGVAVILQDAGELLLLRAEVGEILEGGKGAILSSAMEANFLYQGTGGATFAVNPEDGRLHIHKYNWMERIDADAVIDALDKLADTTAAWRKILSEFRLANDAPPAENSGEASSLDAGFMKV